MALLKERVDRLEKMMAGIERQALEQATINKRIDQLEKKVIKNEVNLSKQSTTIEHIETTLHNLLSAIGKLGAAMQAITKKITSIKSMTPRLHKEKTYLN
jgi:uncharacterized coiled-coil protein SlyX